MQYKIIFDDCLNELRVVPTHIDTSDYVSIDMVFETDKAAKTFIQLINSLMMASWMKDTKMFIRIFNRL